MTRLLAALALALVVTPALARRDLPVPADKGWQHAATGLILPHMIGGLARAAIYDLGDGERDVTVQHAHRDASTQATICVFHPGGGTMPIWFDRAEAQLRLRDEYRGVTPTTPAPLTFAPAGGRAIELRRVYATRAAFKSTGVAALPIGEWLVVVRSSSTTLDTWALDAELIRFVGDIRLPAAAAAEPLATPVEPCATTLKRSRARMLKVDMAQSILGSLLPGIAAKAPTNDKAVAVSWCRDGDGNRGWGMYRPDNSTKSYVLALGDAGEYVSVGTGLSGLLGHPSYGVTRYDLDGSTAQYQSFDRLPPPAQVFALLSETNPVSTTTTSGNRTIFVPATGK